MFKAINYNACTRAIQEQLQKYVTENKLQALVLGVSGGIDSALCAVLARGTCVDLGIPLIGRSITIASNKEDEIERARMVGKAFCDDFKEIDLTEAFCNVYPILLEYDDGDGVGTELERKIRLGNLKARMRMLRLYDLASKHHGMVLSTDNYSELLLGFWSIHGDVGDYGMIQQLWKTEVYALSDFLAKDLEAGDWMSQAKALRDCINAVATDGLGVSNSDLEQLGASSYEEVDRILQCWLCDDEDKFCYDEIYYYEGRPDSFEKLQELRQQYAEHPVVKRYERTHYKRNNPLNLRRTEIIEHRYSFPKIGLGDI